MTEQEEIAARIGLDSRPFARGLRTVKEQVHAIGSSIKSKFGEIGASIAGAFAVSKLIDFGKSILQMGDDLQRTSDTIGTSVEFIQNLNFVASQTGVTVENATKGLEQFSRRIGEAASGNAQAAESFTKLGIALFDRSGQLKSTEGLFHQVSDAIAAIKDPALKAVAAFELFGKAGQKLIPLLNQGKTGFEELSKQIEKLSQADVEKLDELGDKLEALGTRFKIGGGFALLTFMALFKGQTSEAADEARKLLDELAKLPSALLIGSLAKFGSAALQPNKTHGASGSWTPPGDNDVRRNQVQTPEQRADLEKRFTNFLSQLTGLDLKKGESERALVGSIQDRVAFSAEELMNSNLRFSGQLGKDQQNVREILRHEARAKQLRERGFLDPALQEFGLADKLRGKLSENVRSSDREVFKAQTEALHSVDASIQELLRKATEEGLVIQPRNGK